MVDQRVMEWQAKFEKLQGGKEMVSRRSEASGKRRCHCLYTNPGSSDLSILLAVFISLLNSGTSFQDGGDNAKTFKTSFKTSVFLLLMRCSWR